MYYPPKAVDMSFITINYTTKLIFIVLVEKHTYSPNLILGRSCQIPGMQQRRTTTKAQFVIFRGRGSDQSIEE